MTTTVDDSLRIELDGVWNQAELESAMALAQPSMTKRMGIVAVIVVVMLALPWVAAGVAPQPAQIAPIFVPMLATFALLAFILPRARRKSVTKMLRSPAYQGSVRGSITANHLELVTGHTSSRSSWSNLSQSRCNAEAVALRHKGGAWMLVLRNWFPDHQSWQIFNSRLNELMSAPSAAGDDASLPSPGGHAPVADGSPDSPPFVPTAHADPVAGAGVGNGSAPSVEPLAFGGPIEVGDVTALLRAAPQIRRIRTVLLAVAAVTTLVVVLIWLTGDGLILMPLIILAAWMLALAALAGLVGPWWSARVYTKAQQDGVYHGMADDQGYTSSIGANRSELRWDGFVRAVVTDRGVALYWTEGQGFSAVLRSWFASDADWNRFLALVRSKVPNVD